MLDDKITLLHYVIIKTKLNNIVLQSKIGSIIPSILIMTNNHILMKILIFLSDDKLLLRIKLGLPVRLCK